MKRKNTALRLAAVAAAGALVLAGCGSDGDDETASPADESSASSPAAEGDGTLTVGPLLPQTGSLAFLGPPGVRRRRPGDQGHQRRRWRARQGRRGRQGRLGRHRLGHRPGRDRQAAQGQGSDVIVGAASSGVSLTVIDKIMSAGVDHVLAGQHVDRLRRGRLLQARPLLPHRSVGHPPGRRDGQPAGRGRPAERGDPGSPGRLRRDAGRADRQEPRGRRLARSPPPCSTARRRSPVDSQVDGDRRLRGRRRRPGRLRGDHHDRPAADPGRGRPAGRPDVLRRRQHRQLRQGLLDATAPGHAQGHQGHHPRCRDGRGLQGPAARGQPQADGLLLLG